MKDIKTIDELEKILGKKIPQNEYEQYKKILREFPVRLSKLLLGQIKKHPQIAKQFLPDKKELSKIGSEKPFKGLIETGIEGLERLYVDRCIIMPINQCPAYCRFCFRKFYEKRMGKPLNYKTIDKAIEYIKKEKKLKSVLITGGDPFLDPQRLEYIIKNLRKIDRIEDIRIGSRSLMYAPKIITDSLIKMLLKYHDLKNFKPIEIGTHFNHPAEITPQSKALLIKLAKASIKVYNQAVLLKNINDDPKILEDLFRKLRNLGVEIYALYHCDPVCGTQHFRTKVAKGIAIKKYFRGGFLSGRINPSYIVDTRIGKVEIGVDGFIEKKEGPYLWIKTPYKLATYKSIDPQFKLPEGDYLVDKAGFISVKYLDGKD